MAGKATIPAEIHAQIRKLSSRGTSIPKIMETIGCSRYTVLKALDPDFAAKERERQRRLWPLRAPKRAKDQAYQDYLKNYYASDHWRSIARSRMAEIRARRRELAQAANQSAS